MARRQGYWFTSSVIVWVRPPARSTVTVMTPFLVSRGVIVSLVHLPPASLPVVDGLTETQDSGAVTRQPPTASPRFTSRSVIGLEGVTWQTVQEGCEEM